MNNRFSPMGAHSKPVRYLIPALCILLGVALFLTLILTDGIGNRKNGTTMEELKRNPVLRVAFSTDCAPYAYQKEDGSLGGIEVELMEQLCVSMGWKLDGHLVGREEALEGVANGTYHLVTGALSSATTTPYNLLYTNPYSNVEQMMVCKLGGSFNGYASLPTAILAVKAGTYSEALAQKQQYITHSYGTLSQTMEALKEGMVDALLLDRWMAAELLKTADAADNLVMLDAKLTTVGYSFAMAPGSDEVVHEMNVTISKLAADGVINHIFDAHDALYHSPY